MAAEKYNVLIATEYTDNSEQVKTSFTQVGVAFPGKNKGTMSVLITEGISVSGRLVICKPKPRREEGGKPEATPKPKESEQ